MIQDKIRLSKSVVGVEEANALADVIKEGYLGMGTYVHDFELAIKRFLNTDFEVTCVNSGTAALHLAVQSVVQADEEVLVQSLTFLASYQAISACGAVPVACEINEEDLSINLIDAERKITNKTKAIMPVHYAGNPSNMEKIHFFAEKHNLRVIEDAAHAFGSRYKGNKIGSFGDIVCFSFDGIKNITSGEGGAVVSADNEVNEFVKNARLLGIEKDTEKRYKGQRSWEFNVSHQGYRFHMSNLFAAIGITQLNKFSSFKEKRQELAKIYHANLKDVAGVKLFEFNYDNVVPHIFPIRVLNDQRDGLREHLLKSNIECGIHYIPNHQLSFYKSSEPLVKTEEIYQQLLTVPLHPDLTFDQQKNIIYIIQDFITNHTL
jgi:dTDP-4-amino-4,6-dideoxygalactose transaminase